MTGTPLVKRFRPPSTARYIVTRYEKKGPIRIKKKSRFPPHHPSIDTLLFGGILHETRKENQEKEPNQESFLFSFSFFLERCPPHREIQIPVCSTTTRGRVVGNTVKLGKKKKEKKKKKKTTGGCLPSPPLCVAGQSARLLEKGPFDFVALRPP